MERMSVENRDTCGEEKEQGALVTSQRRGTKPTPSFGLVSLGPSSTTCSCLVQCVAHPERFQGWETPPHPGQFAPRDLGVPKTSNLQTTNKQDIAFCRSCLKTKCWLVCTVICTLFRGCQQTAGPTAPFLLPSLVILVA